MSALAAGPDGAVYLAGSFGGTVQLGAVTLTSTADGRTGFVARWNPATKAFAWGWALGPTSYAGFATLAVRDSLVYAAGSFEGDSLRLPGAGLVSATDQPDAQHADALVVKLADRGSHAALTYAWPAAGLSGESSRLVVTPGGVYLAGTFIAPGLQLGGQRLSHHGDQYEGNDFLARLSESPATRPGWLRPLSGHRYRYGDDTSVQLAASGSSLYLALNVSAGDTLGQAARQHGGVAVLKLADDTYQPRMVWSTLLTGSHRHAPGVSALAVDGSNIYLAGSFGGDTLRVAGQPLGPVGTIGNEFVARLLDAGLEARPGWWQRVGVPVGEGLLVSALVARSGHLYLVGAAYEPTLQLGRLRAAVRHPRQPEMLVAHLDDTSPAATFTWATTAGIRGIWRHKWVFIPGRYRGYGSHRLWPRWLTARALLLAGPQLYLAGDTEGVARFGRQRLRYPARGRRAAFLAALPAPP